MSKKVYIGKVVSNKMQKTVKVTVSVTKSHPMYGRLIKTTKNFMAHTDTIVPENSVVEITESRPYSKTVKFLVTKVLESK